MGVDLGISTSQVFWIEIVNQQPVYINPEPNKMWCFYVGLVFDLDME